MSIQKIKRTDITHEQEVTLLAIVRETESALVADDDGNTVTRYYPTPEQNDAMARLIAAYINDIRRAARTAKALDRDDAEMVATETFMRFCREPHERTDRPRPSLAGFISRVMVNEVMNADAEAGAVRIPKTTQQTYFNIVKEAGSVAAAYEICKQGAREGIPHIDPITLLAVARTLNSESVEALAADEENEPTIPTSPSHEDEAVEREFIAWLFTKVTEEQAIILRLAYGFIDTRSETLRVRAGYKWDEPLSDEQIHFTLDAISRATVNRRRLTALKTMREAVNETINV